MPVKWLPFYDIGSNVGVNQPNNVGPYQLIQFMLNLLVKNPVYHPPYVWHDQLGDFYQWLQKFEASIMPNFGVTVLTPGVIAPNGGVPGPQSAIVLLNKLLQKHHPTDYRFLPVSNLVGLGSAAYTLTLPGQQRSSYFPYMSSIGTSQCIFQLPFYDLSGTVGKGGQNQPADVLMVQFFLQSARKWSGFSPPWVPNRDNDFRLDGVCNQTLVNAIKWFQDRAAAHGFPAPSQPILEPVNGPSPTSSTLVPLNYFYYQVNSSSYACLERDNNASLPPSVRDALVTNVRSAYFSDPVSGRR